MEGFFDNNFIFRLRPAATFSFVWMSHTLRLVGSAVISNRLRIYGFLLFSSDEPESKYHFGGNSTKPTWMVYALTPGEGRILVGLSDSYVAAWERFNGLADEFKFLNFGRVATDARGVVLVQPVYSTHGIGKRCVQIEIVVASGEKKYAILVPGPMKFDDASEQIKKVLATIERTKKGDAAHLPVLVEDAVPASALAAEAAEDPTP